MVCLALFLHVVAFKGRVSTAVILVIKVFLLFKTDSGGVDGFCSGNSTCNCLSMQMSTSNSKEDDFYIRIYNKLHDNAFNTYSVLAKIRIENSKVKAQVLDITLVGLEGQKVATQLRI